ncbi:MULTISPECIES: HD domain-containing protein [Sphingobium]|uniref:HD domain-containing protein n=1 Tax=Sphingobium TaxID=165695 RepID=UPI001830191A|nr:MULTISPECIES: HD domain-containing protein [Sphingobium]MCW2362582.1 hypothetical protein [Sphingobium sp. B10D3B]MCW2400738.1 hypothetical protein [Sphingobium sp. B10D7B]MCW2407717.1 hypothetical protein [Sphingobium xanthum]
MSAPDLHSLHAQADALEEEMSEALDAIIIKSTLYQSGDVDPRLPRPPIHNPRRLPFLMGPDPRLPLMPEKPTLVDFFRHRFGPSAHVLQSAKLARDAGHDEKIVLACLLHDIAVTGFIRADHGYWAAQLIEPYVDPEVSWAVREHQVVRFYPDESVGYDYPEAYIRFFGADYRPDPHIDRAYQRARNHKWYMSARLVTLNDFYAFDPNVVVDIEEFTDIIGRHFRQPEEGLGFDDSPSAHMWRTIMMPTRFL